MFVLSSVEVEVRAVVNDRTEEKQLRFSFCVCVLCSDLSEATFGGMAVLVGQGGSDYQEGFGIKWSH